MNTQVGKWIDFQSNLKQFFDKLHSQSQLRKDVVLIKERVALFKQKINDERQAFYKSSSVAESQRALVTSLVQAFRIYFEVHSAVQLMDFDGGGPHTATREIIMNEEWLLNQIQACKGPEGDAEKALSLINYLAYQNVPLFQGNLSSFWDIRVKGKLLEQLAGLDDTEFDAFVFYLALIRKGIFFLHKYVGSVSQQNWINDSDICYSVLFAEAFNKELVVLGAIMPERLPNCLNKEDHLDSFIYRQYVVLTELMPLATLVDIKKGYMEHKREVMNDADRFQCFRFTQVNLRKDAPKHELFISVQHKHLFAGEVLSFEIKPLKIFKWMLQQPPLEYFKFDEGQRRWVQVQFEQKVVKVQYESKDFAQKEILNQLESKKHTEKMAQLLKMLPTMKIKLSDLQMQVVKSNRNLLCLGRSGTGKTTTSVLRLFAQEVVYILLYKQRRLNQQYQEQVKNQMEGQEGPKKESVRLLAKDLVQPTGTKLVFITASPVLTNEVMRFYGNLKKELQMHLERKEARLEAKRKQKREAEEEKVKQSEIQQIKTGTDEEEKKEGEGEQEEEDDEEDEDIETIEDQEKKELLEFIKKEEQDIMDDQQLEGQLDLPFSYNELGPKHFPMFVTVKRLILMMDACLYYSFFSRDSRGKVVGLDSNLGWHNESKGVMMINHYYKESIDYDAQLAKFGKEILDMDKEMEITEEEEEKQDMHNFKLSEEKQRGGGGGSSYYSIGGYKPSEKFFLERQQLSFEVDYDNFESMFWPKIVQKKNLKRFSPTLVWTEIYSVIKGGHFCNSYYLGYLPKHSYVYKYGSDFLTVYERKTIYYIFLEYERWKASVHAYDFMDLVTHIQKRLWYGESLRKMKMDFLMVDEVQDLTPKTIQLLLQLTQHNVFFSGDTAQTIAKGVGARFLDLRHIFGGLDFDCPKIVQLTRNYRSHGRILDLANSVVDLIELFFPKTIDKLQKEESPFDGPKPLLVMPLDIKSLRMLFLGTNLTQEASMLASPQFGCNQVIIVRDQEAKKMVPDILKNMLCLTVYESKGLEFDDVILFNFFHLGDVSKGQWKLLNDIVYETVRKVKYDDDILQMRDFDSLDVGSFEDLKRLIKEKEQTAEQEEDFEEEVQLSVSRARQEVYRKFQMLCIELKFLYVAITRPKRRLIIYDELHEWRKPIQAYWERLGLVELVTKEMIQQPEELKGSVKDLFSSGALSKDRSSEEEWRLQGIKLLKKKYYDAAVKCFTFSGDEDLVKRCLAYQEADEGTRLQSEAESNVWKAQTYKYLLKQEKKKLMKDAKKVRIQAQTHFKSAGKLFEAIGMKKHSASCYYTGRDFTKAAELFESLEQFGQAAECFMIVNQLSKAAQLYERANLVSLAIECFETAGEWEQLLHCLHRNKEFFKKEERESLVTKYVPVALNSLYKLYSEEEEEQDEQNKGKMHEMKIKLKYQKKVNVIREEEEDYDEEVSSEEEGEKEGEQQDEEEEEGQEVEQEEEKEGEKEEGEKEEAKKQENSDEDIEVIDEEVDILDEVFQLQKMKSEREQEEQKHLEEKKEELPSAPKEDGDDDFEVLEEEKEEEKNAAAAGGPEFKDEFEHLSQYDPDDEFLRSSRSMSIIDSILSKQNISQTSEFSIIASKRGTNSNSQSMVSLAVSKRSSNRLAFVEPNRDIYAEDVITQKIIYYVSLFSSEVSEHLSKLRSKNVMFSQKEGQKEEVKEEDFMIDLDDVDNNFVNLILDALEYYELFRLCLMICNRYQMSDRIGRYLISVCTKYSNLHLHRFEIGVIQNRFTGEVWREKQRQSSILAHEAIHNVFALINPKFLELKEFNDLSLTPDNSLGIETYRMMMELGFWKKLVYIINGKVSLQLCEIFFNRDNFDILKDMLELATPEDKLFVQEVEERVNLKCQHLANIQVIKPKELEGDTKSIFSSLHKQLTEEQGPDSPHLKFLIQLHQMIYNQHDPRLRNWQNLKSKEQKEVDKIYNNLYNHSSEVLNYLHEHVFTKSDTFDSFFLPLQLALAPQSQFYKGLLYTVEEFFDTDSIQRLLSVYFKCLKVLNLETYAFTNKTADTILNALYGTFLVSSLHEKDALQAVVASGEQMTLNLLFQNYKDTHVLVNRLSPIYSEILQIQNNIAHKISNEFLVSKMQELRPKYFRVQNFNTAMISQFQEFQSNIKQQFSLFIESNDVAFILDMDSEFVMVPTVWVNKLLLSRIVTSIHQQMQMQLTISLSNILKMKVMKQQDEQNEEEEKKGEPAIMSKLEKRIEITSHSIKIMEKIHKVITKSITLHEGYANSIIQKQTQLYKSAFAKNEFQQLLLRFWRHFQLNRLSLSSMRQFVQKSIGGSLYFISNALQMRFDLGILKPTLTIPAYNEIIQEGNRCFKQFLEEKSENGQRDLFYTLQDSFQNFFLINRYEYFLELVKKSTKVVQKYHKESAKKQQRLFILKKYMSAIDAHVFLQCHSWSGAADAMYTFLSSFYDHLSFESRAQICQNAFYLALLGRFGKAYTPDYVLHFLDLTFDLEQYYVVREDDEGKQPSLSKQISYQGDERFIIDLVVTDKAVEKIDKPDMFNEGLHWCIKILKDLNQDEQALVYKKVYKKLYNILISACVNDPKKSDKTYNQIVSGLKLVTESVLEDFFLQKMGLNQVEYTSPEGVNQIRNEFTEAQNEYKWEFFAGSKRNWGQFVAYIDVSKCQTKEAQQVIAKNIDQSFYKETKVMVSHHILSSKLKRLFKSRRKQFQQRSTLAKYPIEERSYAEKKGLTQIFYLEQVPSQEVLSIIKQYNYKALMLRQMIVQKYATNSQDLHFILNKAQSLDKEIEEFLQKQLTLLQNKGSILQSYIEVNQTSQELPEVREQITTLKDRFLEVSQELRTWMDKKAEPNLIEVERKAKKYKLKWQQLNLFEKRQRMATLKRKMEQIKMK